MMPAAHTISSAGTNSPLFSVTPSAFTDVTGVPARMVTSTRRSRSALAAASRSGSASRILGPASISSILMSFVEVGVVEIVGGEIAHRFAQLGGELDADGVDNRTVQMPRPQRLVLRVGA